MSNLLKIVHLSPTPLVGAPAKIAAAQRASGHQALSVMLNDYPASGPLAQKFVSDAVILDAFTRPAVERALLQADVIHVHNDLPADRVDWVLGLNQSARFVYHVHSPVREGPLYMQRADSIRLPFTRFLVVGQYQPRHYPDYTPVPNIIADEPSVHPRREGQTLRVMYSPSHAQGGRWNTKSTPELDKALRALVALKKIELVHPDKPVHPKALMQVRRACHVSIDEIATGGFHQVSLEGLCAGNVVINRADWFCRAGFAQFTGLEPPPFVHADAATIGQVLLRLADDPDETARLQTASHDYFTKHLTLAKLSEIFDAAYQFDH